jgi:alpha-glucosidase
VFNEPLLTYGGHPQKLLDNPAVEMIKSIPAVWDETIALPDCEIGGLAAFARRHGDEWFLVVLNGPNLRDLNTPLSFLGDGDYEALLVADVRGNSEAVEVRSMGAKNSDSLPIDLEAGGGLFARFRRTSR